MKEEHMPNTAWFYNLGMSQPKNSNRIIEFTLQEAFLPPSWTWTPCTETVPDIVVAWAAVAKVDQCLDLVSNLLLVTDTKGGGGD